MRYITESYEAFTDTPQKFALFLVIVTRVGFVYAGLFYIWLYMRVILYMVLY